ncbi:MAG: hypothetical protein EOP10_06480 [Proteobacteria bacterium]|nr:MAG: hypothetical protein EOP10_06480 [Pseudomonadota bacterium]
MKLSPILLSSLLLITGLACKREDGPLSPDAFSGDGQVKRPAVSPPNGTTPTDNNGDDTKDPGIETGTIDPLDPVETRTTESPIDDAWAHQIAGTLQSYYDPSKALWRDTWDVSAQATTALIDFMKLTGTREYQGVIQKVYDINIAKTPNFIQDKFLSNALWASAWIHAFDLTQDKRFLETSKIIMDDMDANGWDSRAGDLTSCGGGVFTSHTDKTNASAPTPVNSAKLSANTAFYIKLNAALHNRIEGDTKYLERAGKGWLWLTTIGVVNNSGLVNNGVTVKCKNDGLQTWTHTQGLFYSAAVELNKASPKKEYIDAAKKLFDGVMINLVTGEGILREANDSRCGTCLNEERMWKGIFMRSVREAQIELKDPAVEKFIENNILKLYKSSRSTADSIGFHWQGPFDSSDAGRQASALELFNAGLIAKTYTNAALNRVAQTTANCAPGESGAQAVDGSALTKWCSLVAAEGGTSLILDLDSEVEFSKIKILHGAAGGENLDANTRNFTLAVGGSATGPFTTVADVVDNTSTASVHKFTKVKSRFIKLQITRGGSDGLARIYELTVE